MAFPSPAVAVFPGDHPSNANHRARPSTPPGARNPRVSFQTTQRADRHRPPRNRRSKGTTECLEERRAHRSGCGPVDVSFLPQTGGSGGGAARRKRRRTYRRPPTFLHGRGRAAGIGAVRGVRGAGRARANATAGRASNPVQGGPAPAQETCTVQRLQQATAALLPQTHANEKTRLLCGAEEKGLSPTRCGRPVQRK